MIERLKYTKKGKKFMHRLVSIQNILSVRTLNRGSEDSAIINYYSKKFSISKWTQVKSCTLSSKKSSAKPVSVAQYYCYYSN